MNPKPLPREMAAGGLYLGVGEDTGRAIAHVVATPLTLTTLMVPGAVAGAYAAGTYAWEGIPRIIARTTSLPGKAEPTHQAQSAG